MLGADYTYSTTRRDHVIANDGENGDFGRDAQFSLTYGRMCYNALFF